VARTDCVINFALSRFARGEDFQNPTELKPLRIPMRRIRAGVDRQFDDPAAEISHIIRLVALGHVFRAESAEARDVSFENAGGAIKALRIAGV
jgi:hypothetical protein